MLHSTSTGGIVGDVCETTNDQNYQFEWKLNNFFSLSEAVNDCYHSPIFSVSDRSFYLRLYPNGDEVCMGWMMLFLIKQSCLNTRSQYTMAIKKAEGKTEKLQSGVGTPLNKCTFGLSRKELLRRRQELAPSDALTIVVKLKIIPHILSVGKLREGRCTQICKEVFWDIDNATRCLDEKNDPCYWSPKYTFGEQQGQMRLCIEDNKTVMYLFMPSPNARDLSWFAGILRADGTEYWSKSGQFRLREDSPELDPHGTWFGPPKSELIRQKFAMFSGDVLTFFVKISLQTAEEGATAMSVMKVHKTSITENRRDERHSLDVRGLIDLSCSLKDLYVAGKDCDVTLKVKEKKFVAHRLILGARTPVLAAMFSHKMAASETDDVCVDDCHPEAFEVFLLFVYSGKAENLTDENVTDVYYIADKYDLPALKDVCVRHMLSNLSIDSVCISLSLASRHSEEVLLQGATEFFVKNARDVYRTAGWSEFMIENTSLANELIIQSHENMK